MAKQEILLETGTNEVEIAVFFLGTQHFGINVAKIREFIQYDEAAVTKLPNTPPSMLGVISLRGQSVPLIDLDLHLGRKGEKHSTRPVIIVTDFNRMVNAFITDGIEQIHRLRWNDIKPLHQSLGTKVSRITGTIHIGDKEILILDLEYIASELFPKFSILHNEQNITGELDVKAKREQVKLVIAEDSALIRNQMMRVIGSVGYTNVKAFDDGGSAWNGILELKKNADSENKDIKNFLSMLILDIEMPQMDGLTLCKKVKSELQLTQVPVIMFSSLINEQMVLKCKSVGADGYITKPQIHTLVELIDKFCLKR